MKRLVATVVLGAAVLVGGSAHADSDIQQWTELGVSKKVNKKLSFSFDQHLRFDQNITRVEAIMPEPGVQVRPKKWLRFAAAYRLQYARDGDDEMAVRHRFHVNGRVRHDLGDVRLEYKLQWQEQYRPGAGDLWRHTLRNRADVSYRAHKRITPGLSGELFHAVADEETAAIYLDKVWLTAGVAYEQKAWTVDLFYRMELPVADDLAPVLHIIGLGGHYEL